MSAWGDATVVGCAAGDERLEEAAKYQPFFFAGDAAVLRACWTKLSDRRKKELLHFDRKSKVVAPSLYRLSFVLARSPSAALSVAPPQGAHVSQCLLKAVPA